MISKLCYWIGRIPKDKILHYFLPYFILDTFLSIFGHFAVNTFISVVISFSIVSIAIFGKEAIDEKQYNGWSWLDILAGYLGVITKLGLFLVQTI